MKIFAVLEEERCLIVNATLFLDENKATDHREKLMENLGFYYDETSGDWLDHFGSIANDEKGWVYIRETSFGDFRIDPIELKRQIYAVLNSEMPEDCKEGLYNLLGTILDSCKVKKRRIAFVSQ